MKKPVVKSATKRRKPAAAPAPSQSTPPSHGAASQNGPIQGGTNNSEAKGHDSKSNGQAEPPIVGDGRVPSSAMRSYALLTPDLKELYFKFYKATYGKTKIDLKTKEFIAIAASLSHGCKGCLEGHLRKAKKEGATADEISEVIAVTLGVAAAAIVDRSDIANFHLGGLFEKPGEKPE